MQNVNRMALGELNPHRFALAAVDSAAPTTKMSGFATLGYKGAIVEAHVANGAISALELDVYVWSDASGKYVLDPTLTALTGAAPGQWTVPNTGGRWCWIFLKTLTGTGTPKLDINVGPLEKTFPDAA